MDNIIITNNLRINDDITRFNMECLGWDIYSFTEIDEIKNSQDTVIYDVDTFRVFALIDGERAEIDVDGVVEFPEKAYVDGQWITIDKED